MNAKELLDEIFRKKLVYDESENEYKLDSNIDVNEGEFLININLKIPLK